MADKKQLLVSEAMLEKEKKEIIDLLNNGDLESITLGETVLDETKLKALLALLENA